MLFVSKLTISSALVGVAAATDDTGVRASSGFAVEEKNPQESFRVVAEMREQQILYGPCKWEILSQNGMKMQKSCLFFLRQN